MRFHWEPGDIVPGRFVCQTTPGSVTQNRFGSFTATDHTAKWTYLIGFVRGGPIKGEDEAVYVLISVVDGMVGIGKTRADLAASLNKQKFRPMPHKWLIATMEHLRDCQVAS